VGRAQQDKFSPFWTAGFPSVNNHSTWQEVGNGGHDAQSPYDSKEPLVAHDLRAVRP
jgi:hypothetical protein